MDRIYRVTQDGETFVAVERGGELRRAGGDPFTSLSVGAAVRGGLAGVTLRAPVAPSKIVCVGLNYKDHAAEQGKTLPAEPLLFIKPSSAVIGPGDPIRIPPGVGRVDHEAELGVVIGRRARRVPAARAWDHILGLICVNDVTARDLQKKELHNTRGKSFDTFAPIGPCIATGLNGAPREVEGRGATNPVDVGRIHDGQEAGLESLSDRPVEEFKGRLGYALVGLVSGQQPSETVRGHDRLVWEVPPGERRLPRAGSPDQEHQGIRRHADRAPRGQDRVSHRWMIP